MLLSGSPHDTDRSIQGSTGPSTRIPFRQTLCSAYGSDANTSPQVSYLTRLRAQYGHSFRMRIVNGHPSCEVLLTVHQPIHPRQKGQRIEAEIHVNDKSEATPKAPIHAVNGLGDSVPVRIAMPRQTRANTMPPKPR